jgi:hypothetical protein
MLSQLPRDDIILNKGFTQNRLETDDVFPALPRYFQHSGFKKTKLLKLFPQKLFFLPKLNNLTQKDC